MRILRQRLGVDQPLEISRAWGRRKTGVAKKTMTMMMTTRMMMTLMMKARGKKVQVRKGDVGDEPVMCAYLIVMMIPMMMVMTEAVAVVVVVKNSIDENGIIISSIINYLHIYIALLPNDKASII